MYSFPILESVRSSMSSPNCCFLNCIQGSQEAGRVVRYSHLFKNFPQFVMIHTVKDFSILNEVDIFSGILLPFLWSLMNTGNLISSSSAFSKSSLNIWNFSVHVLLKPSFATFEHCFANMWNDCNCVVVRGYQAGIPGVSKRIEEAASARHVYLSYAAGRNKPEICFFFSIQI